MPVAYSLLSGNVLDFQQQQEEEDNESCCSSSCVECDDENPQDSVMKKHECSNLSNSKKKEIEHLIDHVVKTKLEEERKNMKKDMLCELELLMQNDRDSHDDSDDEEKKLSVSEHISIVRKYKPSPTLGFKSLNYDTYTLMILSDGDLNYGWILGFIVFLFQLGLGILTIYSQQQARESDFNDTILQIPIATKSEVTILQLLSIFIAVYSQEDVFNAIALPIDLRLDGPHPWGRIPIDEREKESRRAWMWKVLLPNLFKCVQGFIVLFASVVVILQSTEVIELLKDFTALYVISSVDDIIFSVARRGFFGGKLLQLAAEAEVAEISVDSGANDNAENQEEVIWYRNGTFIKTTVLHIILILSILSWLLVLIVQQSGIIAKQKYPMCENVVPSFKKKWKLLENEICDMEFNQPDCAYDGGDCSEFNQLYPGCKVDDITLLGDGKCDGPPYDSKLCRYDGNDCSIESVIKAKYPLCETFSPSFLTKWSLLENGECDMIFNVPQCGMDGGDCNNFNLFYPGCNEIPDASKIDASKIGNGECDGYPYHSRECSYDGFDCEKEAVVKEKYNLCSASVPSFATNWSLIENDTCDMIFNVPECSMDGGDCNEFNQLFPFCRAIKDSFLINTILVRNGICDGYPYNSESCLLDGGDCRKDAIYCDSSLKGTLGDGHCDDDLNVWKCHFDRGDCSQNDVMTTIGDGICRTNSKDLLGPDYEGGDCIHPGYEGCFFTSEYPNFISEINDGKCHNTIMHNTEECGWDGGDCVDFNEKYPNCSPIDVPYYDDDESYYSGSMVDYVVQKRIETWRIGDGICDIEFNTTECGFDEGDCCNVDWPDKISDGVCDNHEPYNTELCGWDGGDCNEPNAKYPNCKAYHPDDIGDGKCDGGAYNTAECDWDGGDCVEFNVKYPNCKVLHEPQLVFQLYLPYYISNGKCDGGAYNTAECGWDGGDCIEFNAKYPNCKVNKPFKIGDGYCTFNNNHNGGYNTIDCGWDGGDCDELNEAFWVNYPDCKYGINFDKVGNTECDGGTYNTEECGWDGGDCVEFNAKYPNCKVHQPTEIGNGYCQGGVYNTEDCGWDGGDCVEFNAKYPNCDMDRPYFSYNIGDGKCDGGAFNTEDCGWDGGDCIEFNAKYPNCNVYRPWYYIGNTECDGGTYNTEECGWDDGDCDELNEALWVNYPNCKYGIDPARIGNTACDGGAYNTEECGWDDGDCIFFNT